jgi:hypothetical protein
MRCQLFHMHFRSPVLSCPFRFLPLIEPRTQAHSVRAAGHQEQRTPTLRHRISHPVRGIECIKSRIQSCRCAGRSNIYCSIREQVPVDRRSDDAYRSDIMERVKTRSGVSRSTVLVAGFVSLVYVSLAAMAASCALSHVEPSNGHAHHGTQESASHNALCAWACQATTDAGLIPESPVLSTDLAVRLVVSPPNQDVSSLSSSLFHSRAPPSASFVLIG